MNRNRTIITIVFTLLLLVLFSGGFFLWKQRQNDKRSPSVGKSEQTSDVAEATYYCPMHPSVTSHKHGNCPICGMRLVKRSGSQQNDVASQLATAGKLSPGSSGTPGPMPGGISLSPAQRVMANVRTVRVILTDEPSQLVTSGRVTLDERRIAQVSAYTGGRIEQLSVNFTGDRVERGRVVATMYSPELYATQQEYRLALAGRKRMQTSSFPQARSAASDLVGASKRRLQLLGMTERQIAAIASGRGGKYTTDIVSPVSGIVTQKLVVPQQYVTAGQPLFQIADLSAVWVEADVYEADLSRVTTGQRVSVTSAALPGVELNGTVAFIQPNVDGASRATRVRIELPNKGMRLKPDMFVAVKLFGSAGIPSINLPASAVVDRGLRQFVWVQVADGSYAPRQVVVGSRSAGSVRVMSGIRPGEVVVVEGGFLLDSEAQLRNASTEVPQ